MWIHRFVRGAARRWTGSGYKLYKDFGDIYKQAVNDMRRAIAVYKKAELEAEIKQLDKEQ